MSFGKIKFIGMIQALPTIGQTQQTAGVFDTPLAIGSALLVSAAVTAISLGSVSEEKSAKNQAITTAVIGSVITSIGIPITSGGTDSFVAGLVRFGTGISAGVTLGSIFSALLEPD